MSELQADFANFIERRLDFVGKQLLTNPEHIALTRKLDALKSTVSKKFDTDIDSFDDGFFELSALYQRASHRQGYSRTILTNTSPRSS